MIFCVKVPNNKCRLSCSIVWCNIAFEHGKIIKTIHRLPLWKKFMMNNSLVIKGNRQHDLDILSWLTCFLGSKGMSAFPLRWLDFSIHFITLNPYFVTYHDSYKECVIFCPLKILPGFWFSVMSRGSLDANQTKCWTLQLFLGFYFSTIWPHKFIHSRNMTLIGRCWFLSPPTDCSLNPFMAPCLTKNFMCVSSLHNLKSFFTHHFMLHVAPQWDSSQNHRTDNFYKNNYISTMSWRSNNQHAAGLLVGSCSKQCCQPHDDLLPHSPGIFLSDLVYLST